MKQTFKNAFLNTTPQKSPLTFVDPIEEAGVRRRQYNVRHLILLGNLKSGERGHEYYES